MQRDIGIKRNYSKRILPKNPALNTLSDIILDNSTSGWKKWKTESGKTLEEIYRK